jgi:hypothetical protein
MYLYIVFLLRKKSENAREVNILLVIFYIYFEKNNKYN